MKTFTKIRTLTQVLGALALVLVLGGCIESHYTVQVKPDGSGVLIQEVAVNQQKAAQYFAEQGEDISQIGELFTREDFEDVADYYGTGVRLIGFEKINRSGFYAYRARFSFPNITQLTIDPLYDIVTLDPAQEGREQVLVPQFHLERSNGGTAVAVEFFGLQGDEQMSPKLSINKSDEDFLAKLIGLKASFKLQVEGRVLGTSAEYISGNTITIFDFNYDALYRDGLSVNQLFNNKERPVGALALLAGKPGVIADTAPMISISFQ